MIAGTTTDPFFPGHQKKGEVVSGVIVCDKLRVWR